MSLRCVIDALVCHATFHFHYKLQGVFMIFNCTKRRFATVVASRFTSQMTKKTIKKSSKLGTESRQNQS